MYIVCDYRLQSSIISGLSSEHFIDNLNASCAVFQPREVSLVC